MKRLIALSLILFSAAALNAMQQVVILPEEAVLEKRLCGAGYRLLAESTDIVPNLARKRVTALTTFHEVERENKKLANNGIPEKTLREHNAKITVIILQESPEAIRDLAKKQPLSPKTCSDLQALGLLSPELCKEFKIVAS